MKRIALLFTIVCTGVLIGMEQPSSSFEWEQLPKELRAIIVSYLHTYKELDDIVSALKTASRTNKELNQMINMGNLAGFTILAHKLADQFGITTADVASKFNTSTAQTYLTLGYNLLDFAGYNLEYGHAKVIELINDGADVNFSSYKTPLELAITNYNLKTVQLLLDAGAKPTDEDWNTAKRSAEIAPVKEAGTIKQLIEDAMKKYPQSH